jgi:predicted amidohydrolase
MGFSGKESVVNVAAVQWEPKICEKEYNITKSVSLIHEAAKNGAQLIVLPEMCNAGYVFESRSEAYEQGEPIPDGPTCEAWTKAAHEEGIFLVSGMIEKEDYRLYNTAVLIGPEGYIGKYRKLHEWDSAKLFLEPGNLGLPVFTLPFGRLGMMICYDGWFPEVPRVLALKGADIICDPSNWVVLPTQSKENYWALPAHSAHAIFNSVYLVCADRTGSERGTEYVGNSVIIGLDGSFLAGPASPDDEEIIQAEINAVKGRYHQWSEFNNPFEDRRTDLFDPLLGYRFPTDAEVLPR